MGSNNFTQTCTRFSQFLKERRSFGHLDSFKGIASLENEIKGMAKDVFRPNYDAKHMFSKNMENERMSLELFPFMSSSMVDSPEISSKPMINSSKLQKSKEEHHKNTAITTTTITITPSMTIFYGGKVMVFEELPQDKALEIMSLACRGTMCTNIQPQQAHIQTPQQLTQNVGPQGVSTLSDLPIARRVSLHRFMEKRKHRIATSAPYQLHNNSSMVAMSNSNPKKLDMMRSLYDKEQLELKL